jgi:mRNA interferase RelE/StbE
VYRVEFLASAAKQLAKLDRQAQRRIAAAIDRLKEEPRAHGALKLRGSDDVWRLRVGTFRVLYQIEDQRMVVVIVRVSHRREAYR